MGPRLMADRTMPTADLPTAALQGGRENYAELIRQNAALVFALCWLHGASPQDAARAAEDVFVRAFHELWMVPPKGFRKWLANLARRRASSSDLRQQAAEPGAAEALDALAAMPVAERECAVLYAGAGSGTREIAGISGKTHAAVRRAIAHLGRDAFPERTPACRTADRLMLLIDDGALPPRKRAQLDFHAATCDQCSKTFERLGRRLLALNAALTTALPGDDLVQRVLARLPEKPPTPPELPAAVKVIGYGWLFAMLAIIVGLALLFLR